MATHRVMWNQAFPAACQGGAVAIGNFDGAHRGHAALLDLVREQARKWHGPAVAVTFEPHPLTLLRPDLTIRLLTTLEDRARLLHDLGAREVLILGVDQSMLELRAVDFFNEVILRRLAVRAMVEGANFCFGRHREGNITLLDQLCQQHGVSLTVVSTVAEGLAEVSSSRIRKNLSEGKVHEAAKLLGRPYSVRGEVATGQQRGRTIGFPTANVQGVTTVLPADGVYAVLARTSEGISWPGAANLGPNPTFAEQERKLEVHLIGFTGDLYGTSLEVMFLERLRETRPFSSVGELVEQLKRDVDQARAIASTFTSFS